MANNDSMACRGAYFSNANHLRGERLMEAWPHWIGAAILSVGGAIDLALLLVAVVVAYRHGFKIGDVPQVMTCALGRIVVFLKKISGG
jgi:hypothetical protein